MATDLFGRGMDVEKVNIVINYDMPEELFQPFIPCKSTCIHIITIFNYYYNIMYV